MRAAPPSRAWRKTKRRPYLYWKARSAGFAAIYGAARTVVAEDVTVPRDRLSEFMKKLDEISKKSGFRNRSHRPRRRWKHPSQRFYQQPRKGGSGPPAGYPDGHLRSGARTRRHSFRRTRDRVGKEKTAGKSARSEGDRDYEARSRGCWIPTIL